ncbi:hypothetical protein [Micromonospora pallida]|uniref:hypothetical protein n=1 Tax=Micromonospora pallida TaxID=145854 RepID=UPI000B87B88A|nr:hypothetical protein [Micromonospora pallida]
MGGAFNTAIRQSLGLAQTRDTVRDVDLILDNTATSSDRLAAAVRPIVNGFLQFAAVGSGFLPGMAGDVGTLATRFEQWAIASRQSGDAQRWMSTGLTVLRQLGEVAWNVVASVRAVVGAGDNGGSTLDFLVQGSAAMRAWLESAEGQQRVGEVLTTLRSILTGVGEVLPVIAGHADTFNDGLNVTGEVVSFAAGHLDTLAKILPIVAAGWVISRSAQTAANIASVIALPIRLAEVAANWGMRSALNAHTAALTANTTGKRGATVATAASTAATTAGDAATKRSVWSINALSGAMLRARAAMVVATVQQWALNIAQMASPTTWIVLGILALIAVIVLIATKTQWFQQAWDWAWSGIKRGAEAVGDWFVHTLWEDWILGAWNGITNAGSRALDWYLSLPGKLLRGLAKVGDILAARSKPAST